MRSTKHPTVHFLFYHSCSKDGEGGSRRGKWQWQADPPDLANKSAVQKEFCWRRRLFFFFQCRGAATGVAGAVKVAPRGHAEWTSCLPFPKLPPKKNFFFVALHGYIVRPVYYSNKVPTMSLSIYKKKARTFVSCTHFTVPESLQKCSSFPFFFISLHKSFFNFCSRYLLRNGMCGQAKLPGPEVQLQKIYSRHPLDFS